jgi:multiple sugar transport system substrate-binding protein
VIFYNITYGVNNHVSSNRQLATYLFLQWAGAAKPYTQLTFNPAGYQDPHHTYSLQDPYVIASYKKTTVDAFKQIVPRTAPPITIRGGSEYRQALSDQIQNVLTKQATPEQAAKNLQDAWDATTDRIGVAKQAKAMKTFASAFPTVTDKPT